MKKTGSARRNDGTRLLQMEPEDFRILYRLLLKYEDEAILGMLPYAKLEGPGDQWLDVNIYHFVENKRAEFERSGKTRGALMFALGEASIQFLPKKQQNTTGIERLKKAYQRGMKHHRRVNAPPAGWQPGKK